MNEYTTYEAALTWLSRGFSILPAQPGSKALVSGYGPYLQRITTMAEADRLFNRERRYNLAVICPRGYSCLDFDNYNQLVLFQNALPIDLLPTYQEVTPRGFHVFYKVSPPPGLQLIKGVEIKSVVISAPSQVDGKFYTVIDATLPIIEVKDPRKLFLLLSEKEIPQSRKRDLTVTQGVRSGPVATDLVSRIKRAYNLVDLVSRSTELSPSGLQGRWLTGLCPWHDDSNPSLWVDIEKGVWGCHACGVKGDVINWYARSNNLSERDAILQMARGLSK
jgi:hypothetical protein